MNPLLPTGYDLLWGFASIGILVLTVVAFISLLKSSLALERKITWALFVLFIPILGSLFWFAFRKTINATSSADI